MTCDPHDVAVKKTLLLNCGNTCRAEIEMCRDKNQVEAEEEKKAQLVVRHPLILLLECLQIGRSPELVPFHLIASLRAA